MNFMPNLHLGDHDYLNKKCAVVLQKWLRVFLFSFSALGLTALVAKFTVPEFEGAHRRITSGLALNQC